MRLHEIILLEKIVLPNDSNKKLTNAFRRWVAWLDEINYFSYKTNALIEKSSLKLKQLLTPIINEIFNSQIINPYYGDDQHNIDIDMDSDEYDGDPDNEYSSDDYRGTRIKLQIHTEPINHAGTSKGVAAGTMSGFQRKYIGKEGRNASYGPYVNVATMNLHIPINTANNEAQIFRLIPNWVDTITHEMTHAIQAQRSSLQNSLTKKDIKTKVNKKLPTSQRNYRQQIEIDAYAQSVTSYFINEAEKRSNPADYIKTKILPSLQRYEFPSLNQQHAGWKIINTMKLQLSDDLFKLFYKRLYAKLQGYIDQAA